MSLIGSVGSLASSMWTRPPPTARLDSLDEMGQTGPASPLGAPGAMPPVAPSGFGEMLGGLVGDVVEKQNVAGATTRNVLLGHSDQLHQSVIAMQEASVAFSLMVETRNKLVEGYQELMRMPV